MKEFSAVATLMKKARVASSLNQLQLGSLVGISTQYISNWERALCAPPMGKLNSIMRALKIDPNLLIEAMMEDELQVILAKVYPEGLEDPSADNRKVERLFKALYT